MSVGAAPAHWSAVQQMVVVRLHAFAILVTLALRLLISIVRQESGKASAHLLHVPPMRLVLPIALATRVTWEHLLSRKAFGWDRAQLPAVLRMPSTPHFALAIRLHILER